MSIPCVIHFIWVGGPLKAQHFENILNWGKRNRGYQIKVWMDSGLFPTDEDGLPQVGFFDKSPRRKYQFWKKRTSFGEKNIVVEDLAQNGFLNQMKNRTFFIDESLGNGRNFGAASDILRVELLLKFGGIYMDVDTYPGKKMLPQNLEAPHGVLFAYYYNSESALGAWCNAVIASEPNNALLKAFSHQIAENYGKKYGLNIPAPTVKRRIYEIRKKWFETRKKKEVQKFWQEQDKKVNEKIEKHRGDDREGSTLIMSGPAALPLTIANYMEDHPEEFENANPGLVIYDMEKWKRDGYIISRDYIEIRSEHNW
jgi:mannosyltransferase OCH1-like enzyme